MTAAGAHRRRGGFTVDPDALSSRADAVDGLADRVHQVAGGPLLLDNGAFGVAGNVFGSVAALSTQILDTSVDGAGPVVGEVAEDLRDCATAYREAEWRTGAGFEGMCR